MPKMIKVTYTRPSEDAEWHIPISDFTGEISQELKDSFIAYRNGISYETAPADALYKIQAVTNSPNNLSMELYMWFPDYPETTPSNLETYVMNKMRAYDVIAADTTVEGTNPLTGEAMTLRYNKGNKWAREYRAKNGMLITSFEEVDYNFPA